MMGLLDWLAGKMANWVISRKTVEFDRLLREVYGGAATSSGVSVNYSNAMRCAAVYACVAVLGESVAQLPLHLYKRISGGKDVAPDHPLYRILHDRPNQWQTAFEFRQLLTSHAALRGNGLAFINRGPNPTPGKKVLELLPIHPDNCTWKQRDDYSIVYTVTTKTGTADFEQVEIFHLRGMTMDGVTGVSPITFAREAVGLAMAAEAHGARMFGNGARPSGVLVSTAPMKKEAVDALRDQWQAAYSGDNQHKVAVLHGGLEFKPLTMTAEDSQFLETRKYQRSEIASLFRVPAHLINDLEKATFSNIEHLGLSFVIHSLMPWLCRWEQAIARDLLSEADARTYFAEHLVSGLMRGDTLSRYQAYGMGIKDGWLLRNEARRLENLNPIPGLDEPLTPLNMAAGAKPEPAKEATNAR